MNPKPYLLLLTGILFLASCSKETSFEKKVAGNDTKGTLLVRLTARLEGSPDSSVSTLIYNNQQRIISIKSVVEGAVNTAFMNREILFYRNSKGIVERYAELGTTYDEYGTLQSLDSLVYQMYFATGDKYAYAIRTFLNAPDDWIRDSLTYSYNDKGRIALIKAFRIDELTDTYFEMQRSAYAYDDKGNIITMNIQFSDINNVLELPQIIELQYNDKLSAMHFGDDAILSGFLTGAFDSPNGLIKIDDPSFPTSLSWSYEYNNFNKPVEGLQTDLITQEKTITHYYYQ